MSTTATQPEYTGINDTVSNQPIKVGDTVVCYDNAANDPEWGLDKKHTGVIVRQGDAYVLKIGNDVLVNWSNAENIEIIKSNQNMSNKDMKCPECKGEGEIDTSFPATETHLEYDAPVTCAECEGTGKVPYESPMEKLFYEMRAGGYTGFNPETNTGMWHWKYDTFDDFKNQNKSLMESATANSCPKCNPDLSKITNIEFGGVDHKDRPDFSDAFIQSAEVDGRPLTDEELDELNENRDFIHEQLLEHI